MDSLIRLPLSMGFSRQEYWSGLPCLPPGDLSDSGIELASLRSLAMTSGFITPSATREAWTSPSVQFSRSVVSDSLRPHESQQARAEQNMAACFIRASEWLGQGEGKSPSFYLDLETSHCFCWSFLGILSEILTGLRSYLRVNELPYHSYLCESLWVCMYTWVACIYQYTSVCVCIQTYMLANCAHTILSWDLDQGSDCFVAE